MIVERLGVGFDHQLVAPGAWPVDRLKPGVDLRGPPIRLATRKPRPLHPSEHEHQHEPRRHHQQEKPPPLPGGQIVFNDPPAGQRDRGVRPTGHSPEVVLVDVIGHDRCRSGTSTGIDPPAPA